MLMKQETKTDFSNLKNAVTKQIDTKLNADIEALKAFQTHEQLKEYKSGYFMHDLTKNKRNNFSNIKFETLINFLCRKLTREATKERTNMLNKITVVENTPDFLQGTLTIEWKKSKTWGLNPICKGKFKTTDGYKYTESGNISGCGYCKASTSTAHALNASSSILKLLYSMKNDNIDKYNNDLFGYGSSNYRFLPAFEGGVGVDCHESIFNKLGFKWQNIASGKNFDVYSITRGLN